MKTTDLLFLVKTIKQKHEGGQWRCHSAHLTVMTHDLLSLVSSRLYRYVDAQARCYDDTNCLHKNGLRLRNNYHPVILHVQKSRIEKVNA